MVASHTTSSSDVVLGWYIWWPLTQLVALMSCVLGWSIWWPLTQLVALMLF